MVVAFEIGYKLLSGRRKMLSVCVAIFGVDDLYDLLDAWVFCFICRTLYYILHVLKNDFAVVEFVFRWFGVFFLDDAAVKHVVQVVTVVDRLVIPESVFEFDGDHEGDREGDDAASNDIYVEGVHFYILYTLHGVYKNYGIVLRTPRGSIRLLEDVEILVVVIDFQ